MRDDIRIYLNEGKYSDAVLKCKELLALDNNNPDLWYSLFLSENGNYINTDFNNLNNELAFNKAIENAKTSEKWKYISEYNLYRDFKQLKELSILFRYNQMNDFDNLFKHINNISKDSFEFNNVDLKDFYDGLDYIISVNNNEKSFNINIFLVNILYIKTKYELCLNLLNELINKGKSQGISLIFRRVEDDIDELLLKISMLDMIDKNYVNQTIHTSGPSLENLRGRIEINLLDGNIDEAKRLIEIYLNTNYEDPYPYLFLLLIDLNLNKISDLENLDFDYTLNVNYKRAYKYANNILKLMLDSYIDKYNQRIKLQEYEKIYQKAKVIFENKEYDFAISLYENIIDYKDSKEMLEKCKYLINKSIYDNACLLMDERKYNEAIEIFNSIIEFEDSKELFMKCTELSYEQTYNIAVNYLNNKNYVNAKDLFDKILEYKDSHKLRDECEKLIKISPTYNSRKKIFNYKSIFNSKNKFLIVILSFIILAILLILLFNDSFSDFTQSEETRPNTPQVEPEKPYPEPLEPEKPYPEPPYEFLTKMYNNTVVLGSVKINDYSVKKIVIPDNVTMLDENCFNELVELSSAGLVNINSIVIPKGVTSIADNVFANCDFLRSIVIPSSVSFMGSSVFEGCSDLQIYCEAESQLETWNNDWNPENCSVIWGYKTVDATFYCVSVEDISGKPLDTFYVTFHLGDEIVAEGFTDKDGLFVLELEPNVYDVIVEGREGYFLNQESFTTDLLGSQIDVIYEIDSLAGKEADLNHLYSLGDVMYDFTVVDTEGNELTLYDLLNDYKAVILKFWYSSCFYCESEFQYMVEAYDSIIEGTNKKYSDEIAIIAINPGIAGDGDTMEDITEFKKSMGLNFFVAMDYDSDKSNLTMDPVLTRMFNITGYPTTIVVDSYGLIANIEVGAVTAKEKWTQTFDKYIVNGYKPEYTDDIADDEFDSGAIESKFEYNINSDNTIIITKYTGNDEVISIPSEIDGYKVTEIDSYVFYDCIDLRHVNVEEGISKIGYGAFLNCSSLMNIDLPESLVELGDYAFENCLNLTNVIIPNSLKSIGYKTFSNCKSLLVIDVPEGVEIINHQAFYGCEALQHLTLPESIVEIRPAAFYNCYSLEVINYNCISSCDVNGIVFGFDNTNNTNIELNIGSSVVKIPNIFMHSNIEKINFSQNGSCKTISDYSFSYCKNIRNVVIPDGVVEIGGNSFKNCENLNFLEIPESVCSIGDFVLEGCNKLTSIIIPFIGLSPDKCDGDVFGRLFGSSNNVVPETLQEVTITSEIGIIADAFTGCKNIESIHLPNSITYIEEHAFSSCAKLSCISIPTGVTSVERYTFSGCSNLTYVEYTSVTTIGECAFENCASLENIDLLNVEEIGDFAFFGCKSIKEITLQENLINLGYYPFYDCSSLETINYNSIDSFNVGSLFSGVYNNKIKINIGPNVLRLPNAIFAGSNTNSINFDDGSVCKYIDERAFAACENIENIHLPNSIISIGKSAFESCTNLNNIKLSSNLEIIAENAFDSCTSLKQVEIPKNVTNMGLGAFANCNLESIILPFVGENASSTGSTCFGHIFGAIQGFNFMYIPHSLTEITISGTNIPTKAFANCKDLTCNIYINATVKSIGNNAFYDCDNFTIYCEALSQPETWDINWNNSDCTVIWGEYRAID